MTTSPRQRRLLLALAVAAVLGVVGVAWQRRPSGIPQAPDAALPLRCRLSGHGWKKPKPGQLPARRTCRRCESLDLPTP